MAMRRMTMRLAPLLRPHAQKQQLRYAGDVLKEEEKAAENIYIKRMEQERMEKARKAGHAPDHGEAKATPQFDGTPRTEEEAAATKNKGIAMAAGVVALASCIYWYATSSKKKVVDEE